MRSGWFLSLAFMQGDVARDPRWAEGEGWKVVGKIQVGQGRSGWVEMEYAHACRWQ